MKQTEAGKAAIRDPNRGPESTRQPRETPKPSLGEWPLFSLCGHRDRGAGGDHHQVL